MKYKLYQYSARHGEENEWEFGTREELGTALYNRICGSCKAGWFEEGQWLCDPVYNELDFRGMLASPCGCEYGAFVDYEDGEPEDHILENET